MLRRISIAGVIGAVAALAFFPSAAFAGALTLHPSGFGSMSYAAWKAQQGESDSTGGANQALYFQKMTTTPTFAAGVAVIAGVEGMPASELTGLAWDHRTDGHCGAGAPRWNVNVSDAAGHNYTVFLGCNAAAHTAKGTEWCMDTQPSVGSALVAATGQSLSSLTINSLAIVFDEGNDTPNPPPAGCAQSNLAGGFVFLDNITVTTSAGPHVWTAAADNGNG
jgi:hypothetical protein